MAEVRRTPQAETDLAEILEYFHQHNPSVAEQWIYFCGAQPVFHHAENDHHSFRSMLTPTGWGMLNPARRAASTADTALFVEVSENGTACQAGRSLPRA